MADAVVLVTTWCCNFAPRYWRGRAVTRGETASLSRVDEQSGTIVSGVVNYRSCELFMDCDIYTCCSMELTMYLSIR